MQAIVETIFDTVYLFSVITIGILMIRKSKGNRQFTMFGIMAVIWELEMHSIWFLVQYRFVQQVLRTLQYSLG